ncbi:nuclear transport factor 2 family protein [Streptomyces spiralis]|uniref:nuclear transport factor 2 family protein n=1 Tax=Streptomyces spiralis TaxID=66376 RepID=UPI0036C3405C
MKHLVVAVDRQLHAYNAHDLEAFTAAYAPDVLVEGPGDNRLRGRHALRAAYARQFQEARCRAEVLARLTEGDWVVDHELAHGLADAPLRMLVAYRVRDGLIDRVTFLA